MSINLDRFATEQEVVMPIVDGWGKCLSRKIEVYGLEDGWYKVTLGNKITVKQKATQLDIYKALKPLKYSLVYAVGTEGIPFNFDNFSRKGYGESVPINFMTLNMLDVARVVQWEDKRFYYYEQEPAQQQSIVRRVKKAFEERGNLSTLRGVTPEIRYAFLLGEIARESYEAITQLEANWTLSEDEYSKRITNWRSKFVNLVRDAITRAGGTYVSHTKRGNGYLVEWMIGDQTVKSQINQDLRIVSAGFCLSGDDRRHSLNSIVNLAKMFKERAPLYITRE